MGGYVDTAHTFVDNRILVEGEKRHFGTMMVSRFLRCDTPHSSCNVKNGGIERKFRRQFASVADVA